MRVELGIGTTTPLAEALTAVKGASGTMADAAHVHPTLRSVGRVTLDSAGVATVTYSRTFSSPPGIVLTAINPSGRMVTLEVTADIQSPPGTYVGATIKGYRSVLLPTLTAIITDILKLSGFDVTNSPAAAGTVVSVIAVQVT